tara:strand:+ start:388 stop:1251 length:864 start_codon:yes stop_codon:yes gene_type:complete
MGKFKLTELLTEVAGGRIGTLNISARELVDKMEELEDQGDVLVKRLDGPSGDGKTNIEFEVHPDGKYNPDKSFSVYDFKFGFDPMDPDHVDETYPFSVGGRGDAFGFAEKLVGAERMGYNEAEEKKELPDAIKQAEKDQIEKDARKARGDIREEDMDMKKEIKFHLDAYKKGTIDGDDLAQAVEEVIFGEIKAPGMEEDLQREDKSPKDLLKKIEKDIRARLGEKYSNQEIQLFLDSLERDISRGDFDGVETMYDNGDHYEDFEEYIVDKRSLEERIMKEKFKRYMK